MIVQALTGVAYLTLGTICIGRRQCRADRVQTDARIVQQVRIEFDSHRRIGASADIHLPDSAHLRQLLREDGVGLIVNIGQGDAVGGQRQNQDRRIRRIDLAIPGIAGKVRRQLAARGVDGGLYVAGGGIDVAVEIELQNDAGRAELADRGHLVDAGDASELALERSRDGGGHGLRTGARQARGNLNDRKFHLRQRRDRKP